jgi:hypothetical protein
MLRDYFAIAGVLFAVYCLFRFVVWTELRPYERPLPPSKPYDGTVKPIDSKALTDRLQHVRQDYAEASAKSDSFKRALLVKNRQEEIGRLAFFQKPPPGPPEHEHGWNALLV